MRLDVYLYSSALASSRTEAKRLIESGAVMVLGKVVTKPSFDVTGESVVIDRSVLKYASRGGLKLEKAIKNIRES